MLQESPPLPLTAVIPRRAPRPPVRTLWNRCYWHQGHAGVRDNPLRPWRGVLELHIPALISGGIFLCYVTEVTWLMCDKLLA